MKGQRTSRRLGAAPIRDAAIGGASEMGDVGDTGDWRQYLRPRAALLVGLLALLLGSFGFSVFQATRTLREATQAQTRLAQAARTAQDAQRLELLASELSGWLGQYALDVTLGGPAQAAQNVYAQSYGATLSELTALLSDLRQRPSLDQGGQALLAKLAATLTQLNVQDGQIRDAYARGTPAGQREGTALVRGEAFTTSQSLAASASALSRRVVGQAEAQAREAERLAQAGSRRLLYFTLGAALLLGLLGALVWEVLRKREQVVGQLRHLAERDGLTGVLNRRRWDELLASRAAWAERHGQTLCVALLDLDHFKAFNDTHGHQAGDDQLRAVAHLLTAELGPEVTVARYGGEEFGLLWPGRTPAQVRQALDALLTVVPSGGSFSAGVAQVQHGEDPSDTLNRADAALYAAKRAGRARTALAGEADAKDSAEGSAG